MWSGTHGLFDVWGTHVRGVSHRSVLHVIVGPVRCLLNMFFFDIDRMIPMQGHFFGLFETTSYSIRINLKPFLVVAFQ